MENKAVVEIIIRVIDADVSVNGKQANTEKKPVNRGGRHWIEKRKPHSRFIKNRVGRPRQKKRKTDL